MRRTLFVTLTVAALAIAAFAAPGQPRIAVDLPAALADAEFWRLTSALSEPEGYFDSDNLVSNEDTFQWVIPALTRDVPKGGVYFGVGPDQNFAYILALQPKLAIITDVRRGNLRVHLMYKALVEQSDDRAAFLSKLFSRRRPAGVGPDSTLAQLFDAYHTVSPDERLFEENRRSLLDHLTRTHGFALEPDDGPAITAIYREFFRGGPDLRFVSSRGSNAYPTYEALQLATDEAGVNHGYLASESQFAALRALERANLILPIVGNFGGPTALRAAGAYVREHGATVSVFYASNVERYLFQDGLWDDFAANVATLPYTDRSLFIRSCFDSCSAPGQSRAVSLLDSVSGLLTDVRRGRVQSYWDVLNHSRGGPR
jgi:hypothetical protein